MRTSGLVGGEHSEAAARGARENDAPGGDDGRIPVLVITGFLGAGKTTLLRNLLADQTVARLRPAVVVNEFGKVGLDGAQLPDGDFARFEINSGSIFCVCTRAALLQAFAEMTLDPRPGIVLVEATGLAEPSDLTALLDLPGLADRFVSLECVCVVDPTVFPRIVHTLRASKVQVESAGLVIVNKVDLASQAQVRETRQIIAALNPGAAVVSTEHCRVSADDLLRVLHEKTPAAAGPAQTRPDVATRTVVFHTAVEIGSVEETLRSRAGMLLRAKGVVRSTDGIVYFIEIEEGRVRRRPATSAEARRIQGAGVLNLIGPAAEIEPLAAALTALPGRRA